jgi:NAD(P)-dependent dehydrogenase (short-subunit alcohol dehydrogenase family)
MFIITGASRGIGNYLFSRLGSEGETVFGTFHTTRPDGVSSPQMQAVDVSDARAVTAWIEGLKPLLRQVVLINCAAINYNAVAHKADVEQWERVIRVNLVGTFNVIHALLPHMRAQGYGRIINFSSVVAQVPVPGVSAYAASKAALWGLTRSLVAENASKNITVNNLNLGYFDIGIIREVPEAFQQTIKGRIPAGSFGTPEDIYRAIRFIVETGYLNGAGLNLNGGLA